MRLVHFLIALPAALPAEPQITARRGFSVRR